MPELETRYCTLCGPAAGKKVKFQPSFSERDLNEQVFSARRAPDRRHFRIVECGDCGILFSDPACDPTSLAQLYRKSSVNYRRQEEQIYGSYAPVLDRAVQKLGRRGAFLEIGGGRGFMLRYGAENGFAQQIEIEPSEDAERMFAPPSPCARFIRGVFERGTVAPGSVSLACFFQMLDHVPDPAAFLADVFEALEPGGAAVCVTHNTRAVSARLLGEKSPIFDIEHTYLFNPGNMTRLFRKTGFQPTEAFPIGNRYALRHWLNLAPIGAGARGWIASSLETARLADLPVSLRAGNFAIIGWKPS